MMRKVAKDMDRGKSAVFVQYEGDWAASIDAVRGAITAEGGELIHSTLSADKAEALQALLAPTVDDLGGEETVTDCKVEVAPDTEAAPADEPEAPAASAPPVEPTAPPEVPEPTPASAEVSAEPDDLSQLAGIGPTSAEALNAAGITTYAGLAATGEPAVREALYAGHILPRSNVATWAMQAS